MKEDNEDDEGSKTPVMEVEETKEEEQPQAPAEDGSVVKENDGSKRFVPEPKGITVDKSVSEQVPQ